MTPAVLSTRASRIAAAKLAREQERALRQRVPNALAVTAILHQNKGDGLYRVELQRADRAEPILAETVKAEDSCDAYDIACILRDLYHRVVAQFNTPAEAWI